MSDGILIVDASGTILDANPAAHQLLGRSESSLAGAPFGHPVADRSAVVVEVLTAERTLRTCEMRVSKLDWHGQPAHLLIMRDISEQTKLLERLDKIANYDSVTGLPNRTLFFEYFGQALREGRRHDHWVGLLFIDIDGFKRVNDTLGHEVGDRFLHEIGQRLSHALREGDRLARLGGDEFVVTLTQVSDPDEASIVAGKLVASLEDPIDIDGHAIGTTASVGVALYPDHGRGVSELMKCADRAMYRAKEDGGNRYHCYDTK